MELQELEQTLYERALASLLRLRTEKKEDFFALANLIIHYGELVSELKK